MPPIGLSDNSTGVIKGKRGTKLIATDQRWDGSLASVSVSSSSSEEVYTG